MKFYLSLFLFISLISCNNRKELKTNLFETNPNTTVEDLTSWGFEVTTIDCGFCSYKKDLSESVTMNFLFTFDDDCFNTHGQTIKIRLDTLLQQVSDEDFLNSDIDKCYALNRIEFEKDSLKIIDILKSYNGIKVSNAKRLGSSESLIFDINTIDSDSTIECTYYAYPFTQKVISVEQYWHK
ncbi:hypothetical protein [Chondrinema litorale]|uniref:hypothetical protein n=1 Tax=Chondrinema litorale TaxID=2994555 RepID=UPI002542C6E5|nr:hypothetical protein [Chondrinema litorale]UZR97974.1 hypothetical protein OQ292_28535 [Chondrinema litorale]